MNAEPTVNDMMSAYAEDAVEVALQGFGVKLDYSESSIELVEQILGMYYQTIPKGFFARLFKSKPSTEELSQVSKKFGGYIGEVFRRSHGGEWGFNHEISPGSIIISLCKDDLQIFPPTKVYKRLTNGPEDNVWSYFRVIQQQALTTPAQDA